MSSSEKGSARKSAARKPATRKSAAQTSAAKESAPSRSVATRSAPAAKKSARSVTPQLQLANVTVAVRDLSWFHVIGPNVRITPGQPASTVLRVPVGEANRVLKQTVRLVADLPRSSSGVVVWQQGESELAVRVTEVALACTEGVVTLSFPVRCDQLTKEELVAVPMAVGTESRPAGLVTSAFTRPRGPALVTALWAEALTAFAWEALIHLAQQLCAGMGRDTTGKALVPGSIAATRTHLLLQPMARHALSWRP